MDILYENILLLFQNGGWQRMVMWLIGALLIFLAIKKEMEPTLLLPIGFGAILMNFPGVVNYACSACEAAASYGDKLCSCGESARYAKEKQGQPACVLQPRYVVHLR